MFQFHILNDEFSEFGDENANALLLAPENKILMIGLAAGYNEPRHLILARYNPDGSHDQTFSVQQSHNLTESYNKLFP